MGWVHRAASGGSVTKSGKYIAMLPTKVRRPEPSDKAVVRERVVEKMSRALGYKIVTVISPAGFGKTTAVSAWSATLGNTAVAWLHVDEVDSGADRFWSYFLGALEVADPLLCERLDAMLALQGPVPAFLDELILGLAAYGKPCVMVLEDYHRLSGAGEIHEGISYVIRHLPENAHLVITSRATLPIPLSRIRVRGELLAVDEGDLAFTPQETGLAVLKHGVRLSKDDARRVFEALRGWPAGVAVIALLCTTGSSDEVEQALASARHDIRAYLVEEVFDGLSEKTQDFLEATAIVDSYNVDLACELTGLGRGEASAVIKELMGNGLFVGRTERDGHGEAWYRYHHLFADLLEDRIRQMDRARVEELSFRARDWLDAHGYLDSAVELSCRIKDYGHARSVILRQWEGCYTSDSHRMLTRWADLMPEEEVRSDPLVCAVLALPVMMAADYGKAREYIQIAEAGCERLKAGERRDLLSGLCMVQRAYLATYQNHREESACFASAALERLPRSEAYLRGTMKQVLASRHCYDDPFASKRDLEAIIAEQRERGNASLLGALYCNLAVLDAQLGLDDKSKYMCEQAYALFAEKDRFYMPMYTFAYYAEMLCAYGRGDFEEALAFYERYEGANLGIIVSHYDTEALCLKAKALYRLGMPQAKQTFLGAWASNENAVYMTVPSLAMMRDWCSVFGLDEPPRCNQAGALDHACVFLAMREYVMGNMAACEEVCRMADALPERNRAAKVAAHGIAALFSFSTGHLHHAHAHIRAAALLAGGSGLVQLLYENASDLKGAADLALGDSDLSVAERAVLGEVARAADAISASQAPLSLTERELEVLKELSSGATVAQAAANLFISKDTAKSHLQNAYGKLGVHSKVQAISVLREAGILG